MLRSAVIWFTLVSFTLVSVTAFAQTSTNDFSPPPMPPVNPQPPQPMPAPQDVPPGTPPPPQLTPQPPMQEPAPRPYGSPRRDEKPGPEIGLMVSEGLFGILTAAGVTLLPYFLLFGSGTQVLADQTLSSVIFVLIFATAPLATAQTQVSFANGSRHYTSDTWPAALVGLAGQGLFLALYGATGWLPRPASAGGVASAGGSVPLLLIGCVGIVPILQMIAINLFKQPKNRVYEPTTPMQPSNPSVVRFETGPTQSFVAHEAGVTRIGIPAPSPVIMPTNRGTSLGASVGLVDVRF